MQGQVVSGARRSQCLTSQASQKQMPVQTVHAISSSQTISNSHSLPAGAAALLDGYVLRMQCGWHYSTSLGWLVRASRGHHLAGQLVLDAVVLSHIGGKVLPPPDPVHLTQACLAWPVEVTGCAIFICDYG